VGQYGFDFAFIINSQKAGTLINFPENIGYFVVTQYDD
jgi:hypothetical protein